MATKKEAAFELFDKGLSASSPDVKALKLKAQTRANYYWEWKKGGHTPAQSPRGEIIGSIDESHLENRQPEPGNEKTEEDEPEEEDDEESLPAQGTISQEIPNEAGDGGNDSEEEPPPQLTRQKESLGGVSESAPSKDKDGPDKKIATTVAGDGIRCVVFLSLETLALFQIASSTQAQHNGAEPLNLGDFLDTTARDYFEVRGKKLGLIQTGVKNA